MFGKICSRLQGSVRKEEFSGSFCVEFQCGCFLSAQLRAALCAHFMNVSEVTRLWNTSDTACFQNVSGGNDSFIDGITSASMSVVEWRHQCTLQRNWCTLCEGFCTAVLQQHFILAQFCFPSVCKCHPFVGLNDSFF